MSKNSIIPFLKDYLINFLTSPFLLDTNEMVYVRDFVQLVQKCIESNLEGGIYNVGCGNPISISDQIHDIADVFKRVKKSDIIYCPDKPSSPQFVLDISKAKHELGYKPQYKFHDLIVDYKFEMEKEPFYKLWGKRNDFFTI